MTVVTTWHYVYLSKQEAQLMLTNPRDTFRGQSVRLTKYTTRYVRYGFLLVFYRNFVPKTQRDLETGVGGHRRS